MSIFTTLTTTVTAALVCASALTTAPLAGADTGTDYGDTNAQQVCSVLADYPSFGGITGIAQAIHEMDGLSYYQAGEAIAEAVYTVCPRFIPLIQAFTHAGTTQA